MKNLLILIGFLFLSNISFSANELFRSRISGFWTNPSTWEYSTNGGGTWITATTTFPEVISGTTEVRNGHNVTVPLGIPLAINEFTIRSGGTVTINLSATLTIGDQTGTDFIMESGSTILTVGGELLTFTEGGDVNCNIRTGANFLADLRIDSGRAVFYSDVGPSIAELKGKVTVDPGQTLNVLAGGYSIRAHKDVINNGTISGTSGASFRSNGPVFVNNGTVSVSNFYFDTTTILLGTAGIWTPSNIFINSLGNVTLNQNIKFGPAPSINFTINAGGRLFLNISTLTLDATTGSQLMTVLSGGITDWVGAGFSGLYTKGTVSMDIQTGAEFKAPLYVNTGTTTAYSNVSPSVGVFKSNVTVDAGATLNTRAGGYGIRTFGIVTNNGTVAGTSGASFYMKGNSYVNNGTTSVNNFNFDSTTSVSGTGIWSSSNISINNLGNVIIANNLSFGGSSVVNFFINSGGVLNPNARTCTFDGTSAAVNIELKNNGATINSGILQTQGTVSLDIQTGAVFNSPLRVNTGTTTSFSDISPSVAILKSSITINAGATLNTRAGGYGIRTFGIVTNNGTVAGTSGASFYMKGNSYSNSGTTSVDNFNFDTTTAISGTGIWSSPTININSLGNVSLANSLTIGGASGQNFNVNPNGVFNPNSHTATFNVATGTMTFTLDASATVPNSGSILTKGNVSLDLQTGSSFNAPVKVNTGVTTSYSTPSPHAAIHTNKIMIDTGATFNVRAGGYTVTANDSVINNGTIGGTSGATFRFYGSGFINNGIINPDNFFFETISFAPTSFHTVSGIGRFTTSNCNIVPGAQVKLLSTHKFTNIDINNGGSLDITSQILRLTGGGTLITADGTIITTGSTVEYNGTAAQTISYQNINYENLTINNAAGVTIVNNLYITGILTISNGDLNLNGKIVSLLPNATLVETSGNTVSGSTGYITATRNLNSPVSLNVAGLGAIITSAANLGLTEIRRGHSIQTLPGGNQSIKRYYAFNPSNNTGLNATVNFSYDESELNGQNENNLSLFKSTNAGSSFFSETSVLNSSGNTLSQSGLNSLARYTFGTGNGFINLTATPEGIYNSTVQRLNLKDTVRVYLRNVNSPFALIDSSKGRLDSISLTANLTFSNAQTGTYYVVVKHRNSIETWSKAGGENYLIGSTLNYNFTSNQSQAFGNNMILKGSRWAIYSGDVNQDGIIDATDLSSIDNDAANFVSGYFNSDLNGDNFIDGTDFSIADNNASNFISKVIP